MSKLKVVQPGMFTDHELGGDFIFNKGLLLNNCEVEKFDYQVAASQSGLDAMKEHLIKLCKGKDLLFIGKGQAFDRKMLQSVRAGGTKILLWYGDIRPAPEKWLINMLPEVDCFFMSSGGEVLERYFQEGRPKRAAFYLNPSDPDILSKYKNEEIEKTVNIVFTARFNRIASQKRGKVIKYLKSRNDVSFYGSAERSLLFNIMVRLQRRLFGIQPFLNEIRGIDYIKAIKSAKIGVGVNTIDNIPYYTSDRLTHYLMFGSFYITNFFYGIEKLFKENEELVWFKNIEELDEKIEYYLSHAEERMRIARAGQQKMLNDYNTKNMTAMMLEILFKGTSARFPWVQILQ
jgi:hypothetical protein